MCRERGGRRGMECVTLLAQCVGPPDHTCDLRLACCTFADSPTCRLCTGGEGMFECGVLSRCVFPDGRLVGWAGALDAVGTESGGLSGQVRFYPGHMRSHPGDQST